MVSRAESAPTGSALFNNSQWRENPAPNPCACIGAGYMLRFSQLIESVKMLQFDNVGTEKQTTIRPIGPGFGSVDFPLSERVQSAIEQWGLADAARYYARHGIKIQEFLILAGPTIRTARSI